METKANILVIGGGPAGTFAAIAAKKQQPAASVVLLTDERSEPYEKPPLSKAVLVGKAEPGDANIAGPAGVAAHGVAMAQGAQCIAIDRASRSVALSDGRSIGYDALVLATGAVAREIADLPAGRPGVHYLRSDIDAHALRTTLRSSGHLLVVGGGLIGLEVAASAAELGVRTTVLEVAPRILSRVCYTEIGTIVHEVHRRHGVEILLNASIARVEWLPDGSIAVQTFDGDVITADAVVVGTGVKPDDSLASRAGLKVGDGIVVDDRCRTSDPNILAAGDVTRFPGPHSLVRLENWRHAQDQGTVAGRNAAGADEVYAPIPSFWSEQYDLYIQGVGWPGLGTRTIQRPLPGHNALSFEVHDGRIVYALGINVQRELAIVRRLIERKITVDAAVLADPAQSLSTLLKR